jgi:hypothetical protein
MRVFFALALCAAALSTRAAAQPRVELSVDSTRKAYYRGEEVHLTVVCKNNGDQPIKGATLHAVKDNLINAIQPVDDLNAGQSLPVTLAIPTANLRAGPDYLMTISLNQQDQTLATAKYSISLISRPNPNRLDVWLWMNGGPGQTFYEQHGFTSAGGPMYPTSAPPDTTVDQIIRPYLTPGMEETMRRGIDATFVPHNGLWERDFTLEPPPPGDDIHYKGAGRYSERYYNPFNPVVAELQNRANERMMRAIGDYPNLKFAFVGMEWVDDLWQANTNVGGLELMKKELGFTPDQIGEVKYLAPGVIPDNDRLYNYMKYVYKKGNGTAMVCQRAAEVIHRFRPDVQVLADPYRTAALYDLYPGLDLIETWTYTNPDPKLMLYIDTLLAACKPANQTPLQVITLLTYAGTIAPEEKWWMLMGPDRIRETSWIVMSRAVPIIGYFYGSECDPVKYVDDTFRVPYESTEAIKQLSDKLYKPYGPMIRQMKRTPRRIALLNSYSSRVHTRSPGLLGYNNEQILHFQSVMEMAHLNTDIVFDETIERYGLDGYDVLVMPKCDTLTSTVYRKIQDFQKRGGILVSDQYLGPKFSNVIRFDFDFTYRNKVNANALLKNQMHVGTGSDDHIKPGTTPMESAVGVTAEDDRINMLSYAEKLRKTLAGKIDPSVWCDRMDVLFNQTESNGVKYLFVINDRREYGPRVGQYKAMLEKLIPQTVNVHVKTSQAGLVAYDLLRQKQLDVTTPATGGDSISFPVELGDLGGTIIALYPHPLRKLELAAGDGVLGGKPITLKINVLDDNGKAPAGLFPLKLTLTDPKGYDADVSDYYCAKDGSIDVPFHPALNDRPGQWKLHVEDLTAGLSAQTTFDVKDSGQP